MRTPRTVRAAEDFGRVRLSNSFFMRDFLYSDIAQIEGLQNFPDDPGLAIQAGSKLCEHLLEPLQANFGRIAIRSAYRSPAVNSFGNKHFQSCGSNERNRARHIWDQRSEDGGMGAMATIAIPWLVDHGNQVGGWQAMAWWIHDHLHYSELQFFPKLMAFNISWHEFPRRHISSYVAPRGVLTKPGMANHLGDHSDHYRGVPQKQSVIKLGKRTSRVVRFRPRSRRFDLLRSWLSHRPTGHILRQVLPAVLVGPSEPCYQISEAFPASPRPTLAAASKWGPARRH
jgi:hypothetical protein